jgi:hypothetical protein
LVYYEVLNKLGISVLSGASKVTDINTGNKYTSSFATTESGNLSLLIYFQDKYGNLNWVNHSFYLAPVQIVNELMIIKSAKSDLFTYSENVYAHWRANFVLQFRFQYEQDIFDGNMAWTDWEFHDPNQPTKYWGTFFDEGYLLTFKKGDYGVKNITLELKNGEHLVTLTGSIEYRTQEEEVDWTFLIYGVAGFVGIFLIVRIVKSMGSREGWKKFVEE